MKSDVSAFLIELAKRFSLKSPKFFQVLQAVGIVAMAIGFIPDIMLWLDIHVAPDSAFAIWLQRSLKVAGGVTWLIAKLPVVNANTVVNENTMPFTEKKKAEGIEPTPGATAADLKLK